MNNIPSTVSHIFITTSHRLLCLQRMSVVILIVIINYCKKFIKNILIWKKRHYLSLEDAINKPLSSSYAKVRLNGRPFL